MQRSLDRRKLISGAVAASAAVCSSVAATKLEAAPANTGQQEKSKNSTSPRRGDGSWPIWDGTEEDSLLGVLNSGHWGRLNGSRVAEFEKSWAERMTAKYCIATSSGTSALLTSLGALNIGPGDEVILPPYTFVATFNAITSSFALPVFVDSDLESFQIDAKKIESAITDNTKLLLPVHIAGSPFDIDAVQEIAKSRNLPFLEDACQAHLAAWRGKGVGAHGLGGCFSFQASKNLNSGEGGAITTNNEDFANRCYNFHTPGNPRPTSSLGRGANYRMTEFQGGMLLSQMQRIEEQSRRRESNAKYLSSMLAKIPGITPAKLYEGCDRSAWHLYMFRVDSGRFGKSRQQLIEALNQQGISASHGYTPLNKSQHVQALAINPHYQKIYGKGFMSKWLERIQCPVNDQLCNQAIWFTQPVLLGERTDMERIANAIGKAAG